ncbi:cysteine-rich receptor-like protein kinase 43 isoform X1 [Prosopis cineraria]|uniref:cysteine-rich receptor-like protein kinase 43 isoform X1 n=1 Tax=Prosopis cineraria TaxID=364024 RepID=UPI0024101F44|nr:cysteine-rich receptor-like protein kinase 43 isoform X1 [Prosopis cineraria]
MIKSKNFLRSILKLLKLGSSRERQNEDDVQRIAAKEQKVFSYETLVSATKNFHVHHKLGEGGFGPVYKGKLEDGREIAVKKLSVRSNQGKKEFINEAKLLARVQHRNVVNLLGYCVYASEKLLVYEYLPHQSLDKIIFKSDRRKELDWQKRFGIITGIARGLLYLHEDSHTCIIHRDIKASNVLLDDKWNPKIADFGMARLYPEDETHVKTRVAGTNGYMAPEYLMYGHLSTKSDVFSFGVLVLEIISGQRNLSFNNLDMDAQNLIEGAYKLYKKGRSLEIMDTAIAASAVPEQVAMCIQLGLLCTQGDPNLRPTMHRVVVVLSKKPGHLEEPTRPGVPGSRYRKHHNPYALSSTVGSSSSGSRSHVGVSSNIYDTRSTATATTAATAATTTNSASGELDPRGKRVIEG